MMRLRGPHVDLGRIERNLLVVAAGIVISRRLMALAQLRELGV